MNVIQLNSSYKNKRTIQTSSDNTKTFEWKSVRVNYCAYGVDFLTICDLSLLLSTVGIADAVATTTFIQQPSTFATIFNQTLAHTQSAADNGLKLMWTSNGWILRFGIVLYMHAYMSLNNLKSVRVYLTIDSIWEGGWRLREREWGMYRKSTIVT